MAKVDSIAAALVAQQAASKALPAIASPGITPPGIDTSQTLQYQVITIPSGQKYPFVGKGNFVYIEGLVFDTNELSQGVASLNYLSIKPDTANAPVPIYEADREIRFPNTFNFLEFTNNSSYDIYLSFWAGFGEVRRDRGTRRSTGGTSQTVPIGAAFAANQTVGPAPITISYTCSNFTQRGRLRKITVIKSGATITNANFKLWLFSKTFTAVADRTAFPFLPPPLDFRDVVALLDLPAFIVGGSGTDAICDIAGLDIELLAKPVLLNSQYNFLSYAALTANAAYAPPAGETFRLIPWVDFD